MAWISPNKLAYYTDLLKAIFASKTNTGSVVSSNEAFAEIGKWEDENTGNENRIGYFVTVNKTESGITMVKGTKDADIRGVVIENPAFASRASSDKYDTTTGKLLSKYDYVAWCGIVSVIDNGTCTVDSRCICGDDGTAIPSENDFGYQVISRVDENHILVLIEPHGDEMNRIAEKVKEGAKRELTQAEYDALSKEEKNNGTMYFITDGVSSGSDSGSEELNIVTWADGSWEDIGAMIEAHYNGDINIADYWSNGDTKRVYMNAISAGTTGESQSAQYIDLTIIDSAHDDLVTAVNGVSKAALTIQSKFCLGTRGYMNSAVNSPNYSLWSGSPRRTWCNNEFKNALPAGLVALIKKVSKVTYRYGYTGSYSSYRGSTTTQDDVFFLSEMEVYGTQALGTESDYGRGADGTQYEYYKTASNRIKYLGIDGTSANVWWLRSSRVGGGGNSYFRFVNSKGFVDDSSSNNTNGLAPAFCI